MDFEKTMRTKINNWGLCSINFFRHVQSITFLSLSTFYWIFLAPFKGKKVNTEHLFFQMLYIGVKSLLIVMMVSCFMGMIMAMQTAYVLNKFNAVLYTGSLVAVSFTRELGPLLTAIVVSGRVGAAMSAEIGTMKVSEEIEALEVMGINPVRFLLTPRIIAIVLMVPCLTIIADVIGMLGGFIIAVLNLHINPGLYIAKSLDALVLKDVFTGLTKSFVFAFIIGIVGCYQGLIVKGGAEGVGRSTTASVVISIVLVIFSDCLFTALFYFVSW